MLDWPPAQVAELLEIGVAAVNSALQRARATLREHLPAEDREDWANPEISETERSVLERYMAAHESGDPEATLALIRDDIRVTMPPAPYLFEGREAILGLAARAGPASGAWSPPAPIDCPQPPATCAPGETSFRAFKIDVLRIVDGAVAEATTFGVKHFPAFGLPAALP